MAQTVVANGSGLNPIWVLEQVIMQYAERENFYTKFTGEGPGNIIQKITQLQKKKGDSVRVSLFSKLGGAGVDSDKTLEGNEESLVPYQFQLYVDQKRHAVRLDGALTEQRSAIDLRKQAAYALGTWARDWMTELITVYLAGARGTRPLTVLSPTFTGFGASNALQAPDSTHRMIGPGRASDTLLTASDTMTTAILDRAWAKTKLLINAGVPIKFPVINGAETPVCVLTPEQFYDLQQDPDWVAAQQNIAPRDYSKSDLFTGKAGMWKGMVIHENPAAVLLASTGGAPFARAQILGCQAGALAFGGETGATDGGMGRWKSIEKAFDFDNQMGYALATILGFNKLVFQGMDNAIFNIDTAYTTP